jgi:aminoglycoside phosphotransferase (APT) family kinase protein
MRQARRLLAAQHPDLADLSIVSIASGWDNHLLRLGDKLALRFPRRKLAAQLILNEQRWLPQLKERLPLAVPAPVRIGIAPTWIHGDLHPRNVLTEKGRLTGIIDWGDLARGDRASDLAAVWMLLPQLESRKRAMAACRSVSDATWCRARGWALPFAVILLSSGLVDDVRMAAIAERTLSRLWEGP